MTWGRGVLVLSGGVDSVVLMHHLASLSLLQRAVFFDYGQRSADEQWRCCVAQGRAADVMVSRVRIPMPTTRGGVYETGFVPTVVDDADGELGIDDEEAIAEWRRHQWSFIEGRNALFLLWAAGLAADLRLSRVYVGFQEETEAKSRVDDVDVALPFVDAVNALLTFGAVSRPVRVMAPWLEQGVDKRAIWDLGERLGVDLTQTYSCEFWPPCTKCGACQRRARAAG